MLETHLSNVCHIYGTVVVISRWEQLLEDSRTRKERLQHAQDQYKKVNLNTLLSFVAAF